MATVDKNFKVKHGLIVEGTTATVNGEDIITTGSTTDNLTEGTTNKYFTDERAQDAIGNNIGGGLDYNDTTGSIFVSTDNSLEIDGMTDALKVNRTTVDTWYDPAGSAATAQANAEDYADNAISTAVAGLAPNYITSTTTEFSVTNGELSLDQLNGLTQVNPASGLQPNNGYATIEYVDDTVSGTEGLRIKSERGWVGSQIGGQLDLDAYRNVVVTSRNGDIVLNADGDTYLGSVGAGNDVATTGYADTAASNAASSANGYTDTQLANYTQTANLDSTIDGYGYLKSADLTGYATETYVGNAIADVVGLAPAALDTLQELAAAFDNSPDTLANLVTEVGTKQDALTAGTNISIVADTISVTGLQASDISDFATAAQTANIGYYDPAGSASTAQTAAENYADTVALTAENNAKGYADATFVTPSSLSSTLGSYVPSTEKGANGGVATLDGAGQVPSSQLGNVPAQYVTSVGTNLDVTAGQLTVATTPDFTAVTISDIAKQVAAEASGLATLPVTIYSFPHATYRAGEFLVKVASGTHTEISKILLTLDTSNNIAITEYGVVGTNGTMASLTAVINGSNVDLKATPVNDSNINVVGTLLN